MEFEERKLQAFKLNFHSTSKVHPFFGRESLVYVDKQASNQASSLLDLSLLRRKGISMLMNPVRANRLHSLPKLA